MKVSIDRNAINAYSRRSVESIMASITIRNLDDALKRRLRIRAAEHGRSMEEEAREILRKEVGQTTIPANLAASIRARLASVGGIDLDLPAREPMRDPPRFD
jgi:plasmid stability protein